MEHFLSQGAKMPTNYIKSVSQETNVKNELFEYHQSMNYPEETLEGKLWKRNAKKINPEIS